LRSVWLALITAGLLQAGAMSGRSQNNNHPEPSLFGRLEWRAIGPANMGGRTTDIEGVPGNPNLVYVATASGGLWKTTNGGVTWTPVFDRQETISIGDIALAPNNPDVIWVGTGESNLRNSVSFGDGVYKSNDGGKTWQNVGLRDSEHISRIVINPLDPDIVYVGAFGHAFGRNEERGVFMTTDGGKTWLKTLYVDSEHGVSDLEIDPGNPNILYAGMWSFERKPWTHRSGSEKGGVFKSIDGGRTWNKLTSGLPKLIGRIGVKVAPSNPNVVYAILESKDGTLYRSDDRGETFRQVSKDPRIVSRGFYYTDMRVDPLNENRIYAVASTLFVSIDGGRSFRSITGRTHIDYHALWIDPKNPSRMWQGQDGGFAVSYDQGEKWEYVNNVAVGQFYQVHADNRLPFYYVSGGLQDNGGWTGPSRTREPAGIMNDDWRMVNFGDGFHVINHPDNPDLYLSESQGGSIVRTDMLTREQQAVAPQVRGGGGPASSLKYRFNWNTPVALSPHDKNTVFFGGNLVFKSTDFGKTWDAISPDLTTNDPEKQKDAGGPVALENSSAEYHCTIISLAESPVQRGMIWAGTDDGNLQLTVDGGTKWSNLIRNVPGLGQFSPVSHVEPSRTRADVAYAAFDRHMLDDLRPYVFKTNDRGRSWSNITGNLPAKAHVHVVREDPKNPNLLYAGTELGLYASYTGGRDWIALNLKNLPTVAIHDILVHPRDNDLILATHGRSIWIFDDATPIQQMSQMVLQGESYLFDMRPAIRFTSRFTRYGIGDKPFTGPNPPYGALITYYLKDKPGEKTAVKLQILDQSGKVIRELENPPRDKGLNRTSWDLRYTGPRLRRTAADDEGGGFGGGPRGTQAVPGAYTVRLSVGDKVQEKRLEVKLDPAVSTSQPDLQVQFDALSRLQEMQSGGNDALRALDSVKEQIQQIQKTVKDRMPDAPKELTDALADHLKQVDALLSTLSRPRDGLGLPGGSTVLDQIGNLFGTIDGVNAAPTAVQKSYLEELKPRFRTALDGANKFISETVPRLNELLRRHNAPVVVPGKPVETGQG
jgi:photosystem II stability/assembly factor-like uncharacterized protein